MLVKDLQKCNLLGLRVMIYSKYFQSIKNEFPAYISTNLNSILKDLIF